MDPLHRCYRFCEEAQREIYKLNTYIKLQKETYERKLHTRIQKELFSLQDRSNRLSILQRNAKGNTDISRSNRVPDVVSTDRKEHITGGDKQHVSKFQLKQQVERYKKQNHELLDKHVRMEKAIKELMSLIDSRAPSPESLDRLSASTEQRLSHFENGKDCGNQMRSLTHELLNVRNKLEALTVRNKNLKIEYNQIVTVSKNERERNRQFREDVEAEIDSLDNVIKRNDRDHKAKLETMRHDLREVTKELDNTKLRLSQLMGQALTDNNPNIADLGDRNRPTKLAERFTELYDNQWTDAFEVINKGKDQETIDMLLSILKDTYRICTKEAGEQLEWLKKALVLSNKSSGNHIPDGINKQLKDCRKSSGELSGRNLYEKYIDTLRGSNSTTSSMALKVQNFTRECFNICWLMSIQDPPVVVGPDLKHGERFNSKVYKAYTKSGPMVDYAVWPALYLHEGGAVLSKGVAQGFKGE